MTTLSLISVPVKLSELRRLAALRNFERDEGLALHHFLSETFGKSALQPFRLMAAPGGRSATLYGYSGFSESLLRENLELAAPELLDLFDTANLKLREMPHDWREGRLLAFDLRVRPVRRLRQPLEGWSREQQRRQLKGLPLEPPYKVGSEVDAFLVATLRQFPDGAPDAAGITREEVYLDWLEERLSGAAAVDRQRTRLTAFERSITARRSGATGDNIAYSQGPDATFHGVLALRDSAAFSRLLVGGVGRHTAFGFGMMLLRPAGD